MKDKTELEIFECKIQEIEKEQIEVGNEFTAVLRGDDVKAIREWGKRFQEITAFFILATTALFRLRALSPQDVMRIPPVSRAHLERAVQGMLIFIGREDSSFEIKGDYVIAPQPLAEDTRKFLSVVFAQYKYYLGHEEEIPASVS